MNETEQKAAFAAFLLRAPNEPFEAALKLFPSERERGAACYAALNWPADSEVIAEIQRLKDSGVSTTGPNKDELIATLWGVVNDLRENGKDRIAAARLISEMNGYIKKDGEDSVKKIIPKMPVYKVTSS